MKKILLLLCLVFVLTGCSVKTISNDNIDTIIDSVLKEENSLSNSYFSGYKYYLPRGIKMVNKKEYNAKLVSGNKTYYLFVDVIAYYNKASMTFTANNESYYSRKLYYNGKEGYIEITKEKDNYFIELMYNYAKIETLVKQKDLNSTILRSLSILSSIKYNDIIIETLIGENVLDYKETMFNIFGPHRDTDEFLKYEEDYQYQGGQGNNKDDSEILQTESNG